MLIAIPAFRLSCSVAIDRGRAWSVIDEMILWALSEKQSSIGALAEDASLPRQIIVASVARLMRFRLIELTVRNNGAAFHASAYGKEIVKAAKPLPFFPKREMRRVSVVIEKATGSFFPASQVRPMSQYALDNDPDPDKRVIVVTGGGPSMSHEANLARLSQIATRSWEEQVALIDSRTASLRSEYVTVRVVDGVARNVPDTANETLRGLIQAAISLPSGTSQVPVGYSSLSPEPEQSPQGHACYFKAEDLVIGGQAQLRLLTDVLQGAAHRVIIHSTFLDHRRFKLIFDEVRRACVRGVSFDLLWGAEVADEEENRNATSAIEIAKMVREDRDVARRFRMHMRSTGSHAKLLLADKADGDWIATVGSCNWLSSPFQAVEVTTVLRSQAAVADVAVALQRMVGRKGISDDIATEMMILGRELRKQPASSGPDRVSLVLGDGHDTIMRSATGTASRRILVGTNRLGSTARPGMVMQGEAAAARAQVDVRLLYTIASGPLKNRHAKKLAEEAADNGVRLVRTSQLPLHGKFLAWDDDDIVVSSLNWGSATAGSDFPQAEIGVHISSKGIGKITFDEIDRLFPEVRPSELPK